MGYAAARVAESKRDSLLVAPRGDRQFPAGFVRHGPLAVLGQIEQHLQQALPVRPNQRQSRLNFDGQTDVLFAKGGLDNDAKFFEQGRQIDAASLVRHLPKIHRRDFFERQNQVPKRFEVLVLGEIRRERRAPGQIGMRHGDRSTYVPDLVRDRAHQNPRPRQKLVQTQLFAVSN